MQCLHIVGLNQLEDVVDRINKPSATGWREFSRRTAKLIVAITGSCTAVGLADGAVLWEW